MATDLLKQMTAKTEIPSPPADPFSEHLAEFVRLEKRRRELEAELDDTKKRAKTIQEPLLEHFADLGVQNIKADGLVVYVKTNRFVTKRGGIDTERVCDALRDAGLGYMVAAGYSAASLKGKVREWQEEEIEVPPHLAELLNIGEAFILATRT